MHLVSFMHRKRVRTGALLDGTVIDLGRAYRACIESAGGRPSRTESSRAIPAAMPDFLAGGAETMAAARRALDFARDRRDCLAAGIRFPLAGIKLLSPVPHPGKIICIGLNYPGPPGSPRSEYPVVFLKAASSVIASGDTIYLPRQSRQVFYEAELTVVIGSRAKRLPPRRALSCVAGFTMANDLGARDLEYRTSQWTTGKLMDTFCPLGPALVTADEIPDPNALEITTRLNGQIVQRGNTRDMFFAVPDLVSYISELTTLYPGDVILTGSPRLMNGEPALVSFLKHGDDIEVELGGLGILRNPVAAETKGDD